MTLPEIRSTTILAVRRDGKVAIGGDGQVSVGETVMKSKAVKVRTLREFRDALARVDAAVVYLHVVEARGRKGRRRNDFAWIPVPGPVWSMPGPAAAVEVTSHVPRWTQVERKSGGRIMLPLPST